MTKKCPFISMVVSTPRSEVGGLVFTSAQTCKAILVDCIMQDCMAWETTYSTEDTGLITGGRCKLIEAIEGRCY
jgi:hypothetical protein